MPAATVARPARAVPDTARRQPQASHIDLTERNQFAVTKPAPHHSSSHATSLDPEDTTTNSRQARSITERQWLYPGKSHPQLALEEVMAKVQSAQQVTSVVAEQVEAATTRLDGATEAIVVAKERQQKALQESSKLRAKDLWDAIQLSAADQQLKDQVNRAADDLGLTVATDSAQDLMRTTHQVVDLASRTRVLAISKPWYRSPLAYAFYAAVIIGSLGLLIGAVVHTAHEWAGTAITAIGQLAAIGSAAAAWIVRQGGLARRFIAPAETLQRRLEGKLAEQQAKNERELAALEQEADTAKAELAVALQQRAAAEQQLAAAKKEKTELTGKRLLRRYLAERASSGDYDHYMGVVVSIHGVPGIRVS